MIDARESWRELIGLYKPVRVVFEFVGLRLIFCFVTFNKILNNTITHIYIIKSVTFSENHFIDPKPLI